ncbi:hypothetical protein STXM2123_6005 [Streptomyces sp. F-3]|nr:hypothetical protein STXM2123_6005 [Streptomyces sp. F-3]
MPLTGERMPTGEPKLEVLGYRAPGGEPWWRCRRRLGSPR